MYAKEVIQKRVESEETRLRRFLNDSKFSLQVHSPSDCQKARQHFDMLLDDEGRLKRDMDKAEVRWILNERALCRSWFEYFRTRYYFITTADNRLVLFEPTLPQVIQTDVMADLEKENKGCELVNLKARQVGITTDSECRVAHRITFFSNVNAVIASSNPQKSALMAGKMDCAFDELPWWLTPKVTRRNIGKLLEFGDQNSGLTIQSGAAFQGVARGMTPTVAHLSEISEWNSPQTDIDDSMLRAMHANPELLVMLESTALAMQDWLHHTWKAAMAGKNRFTPRFFGWYVARSLYPTDTWLKKFPPRPDWIPDEKLIHYAEKCRQTVLADPYLVKYLGSNWVMPREQLWFYAFEYEAAHLKHAVNAFLREMPADQEECVAADSYVSTESGISPIAQCEGARFAETGEISNFAPKGSRQVVRLITKNNRELIATPDHRVALSGLTVPLFSEGWKEIGQLERGERIKLSPPRFASTYYTARWPWAPCCQMSTLIHEDWARLLGYFMGDGSWHSETMEIACDAKDQDVVIDVSNLIAKIIGRAPIHQRIGGMVKVRSSNIRWWEMLFNLRVLEPRFSPSLKRNSGYKKHLRVPECIFRSPKTVVREFLRGLFEADGHADRLSTQVQFFQASDRMMRDVQLLLLGFGINPIVSLHSKHVGEREFRGWEMRLNGRNAEIFYRDIGFVGKRKMSTQHTRKVIDKLGRPRADYRLPILMEDEVVSVTPLPEPVPVYDLSVADTHCFGANGILVHNCWQVTGISVLDPDLLEIHSNRCQEPIGVYGFVAQEEVIRKELQANPADIDPNQAPIEIDCEWREGHRIEGCLMPLRDRQPKPVEEEAKLCRLWIWEWPRVGHQYGIAIDSSEGLGLDQTAIECLRRQTTSELSFQSAELASNVCNAVDAVNLAMLVGALFSPPDKYGNTRQCKIIAERRSESDVTQLELRKHGWTGFHQYLAIEDIRLDPTREHKLGWMTTVWSRRRILAWLLYIMKAMLFQVNSKLLLHEFKTLHLDPYEQKIRAERGAFDDRLMATAICWYCLHELDERQVDYQLLDKFPKPSDVPQYPTYPEPRPETEGWGMSESGVFVPQEAEEW